jgi:hypothetical protein
VKVRDFDRSSGDRIIQQEGKVTGLPLWVIEVINPDPETRQRTVKVKIAAQYQPVLPDNTAGSPFIPVEFEGMQAIPYVDSSRCQGGGNGDGKGKCKARLAYSLKATGVRALARLPSPPGARASQGRGVTARRVPAIALPVDVRPGCASAATSTGPRC